MRRVHWVRVFALQVWGPELELSASMQIVRHSYCCTSREEPGTMWDVWPVSLCELASFWFSERSHLKAIR